MMYTVTEMGLSDVVEHIRMILDGSTVEVDGITATAVPNPAYTAAELRPNEGQLLVSFSDTHGRRRVAEVSLTAHWVEDTCWHLPTSTGDLGTECEDCGHAL